MKLSYALLITTIACAIAVSTAWAGSDEVPKTSSQAEANACLVIRRAANFGNWEHFNIYIDGTRVANLGYGETYRGLVPSGDHLIRIEQMPHWNGAYPYSEERIRVAQGRPNVFTATWTDGGNRISLL
jgi:hypothetical protein